MAEQTLLAGLAIKADARIPDIATLQQGLQSRQTPAQLPFATSAAAPAVSFGYSRIGDG
ncbi:MAG: hypothetical protein N838_07960 [Thiohalocapsa sp. PB-PSB1]|jgi:hypothetical protein|nr:MAG: hypothetical protein N838_07960 [Thiohalocapsa sp. PB-PSB1]